MNLKVKYVLEYVFSLFFLILFFPVILIIYLIILLIEKRNPIFKQKRVGKGGKEFYIYKFQTMVKDADKVLEKNLKENENLLREWLMYKKLKNDPRITKLGKILRKFSLDELPQFFNVIKGDMTLIGPRPYLLDEIIDDKDFFKFYISLKPGITGLWQITGRNEIPFSKRVVLDKWYIKKRNLCLDLYIFLKTFIVVLQKKGSY